MPGHARRAFDELYSVVSPEPVAWSRVRQAPDGPDRLGGTYVVVFRLDADADVTVGRPGTFPFPAGYYCYVGTAFGGGGVGARTARHRTPVKAKKKWNIDYLTPYARAIEVWWTHDTIKRECTWSSALASVPGFAAPARASGHDCRGNRAAGFGAPDGRLCKAHLYLSHRRPRVHDFAHPPAVAWSRVTPRCTAYASTVTCGATAGPAKSSGRVAVPRPDPGSSPGARSRG